LPNNRDRLPDWDNVTDFNECLQDNPANGRLDFDGRLIALDLGQHITLANIIADILDPVQECAFTHIEAKLR
jgi:hypothetical protein